MSYPPEPPGMPPPPQPPPQWQPPPQYGQGPPQPPPQWQGPPQYGQGPPIYRPAPPALAPNGQPLASFTDRFLAALLDYAIYVGVSMLWTAPLLIWWYSEFARWMTDLTRTYGYDPDRPDAQPPPPDFSGFFDLFVPLLYLTLVSTAFAVLYTYIYWVEIQKRWGGQTVGKRVIKIRVIAVDPAVAELDRGAYIKRWAVEWLVGMVIPFFNLLDGLWQLGDKPLQQCLHDKAARTAVVKVG